jgi:hypothetical protein
MQSIDMELEKAPISVPFLYSEFFLNSKGEAGSITTDKKPKMHQGTSFTWS